MLNNFYYDNLNSQEQYAYNIIRSSLLGSAPECVIRDIEPNSVNKAWKAVVLENPEIIYYPGLFCVPYQRGNAITIRLEYYPVDQDKFNRLLDSLLEKINRTLSNSASDYAVCKTIYDILATTITYKYNVLNEYFKLSRENSSQMISFMEKNSSAFTPYGAVVEAKGVCQGISKLYKILCNRFGVECACVEAKSKNSDNNDGVNHMLNAVEINGAKVFVDVSGGLVKKDIPVVNYDFFLCPARIIKKEYSIPEEFEECRDESVNYYVRNGLRFTRVEDLRRYLSAYTISSGNGEIRIHYDGKLLTDNELQDLFLYITNSHCEEGKYVRVIARNGFCTGKIFDDPED